MTATAIKPRKNKLAPFQSQTQLGRVIPSSVASAPLPVLSSNQASSKQESLSDWEHAS